MDIENPPVTPTQDQKTPIGKCETCNTNEQRLRVLQEELTNAQITHGIMHGIILEALRESRLCTKFIMCVAIVAMVVALADVYVRLVY
jgi:hypothetical protein